MQVHAQDIQSVLFVMHLINVVGLIHHLAQPQHQVEVVEGVAVITMQDQLSVLHKVEALEDLGQDHQGAIVLVEL